ncbi:MAG: beta-ketoacyl synthase N-terminal-like domain-containing protein [Brevinematales bacterium]
MKNIKKLFLLGSGWISTQGYGFSNSCPLFSDQNNEFELKFPPLEEMLEELPTRYGRFDIFTKIVFSTACLSLKDANFLSKDKKRNVGIVVGTSYGTTENDILFFKTTIEKNGLFTSPNLFSYTLPNISIGELAVYFSFTGPTFCVGNQSDNPGIEALMASFSILNENLCDIVLVGCVESNKNLSFYGGMFSLISTEKNKNIKKEFSVNETKNFLDLFGV